VPGRDDTQRKIFFMTEFSASPRVAAMSLWRNRDLIWQLAKREVIGRYRGSVAGLLWSFLNPLLLLVVYTFVFSVVFKARWSTGSDSKTEFAILVFAGMIVHAVFSESVNRAPTLILGNANYVKKIVFPLEILPWVALGSSLFHAAVSLVVLLLFFGAVNLHFHPTTVLAPIVLLPLLFYAMGVTWFLASLGVFIRDVAQTTGLITSVLMFTSPVFYPLSALPERYHPILYLNPLTLVIEQFRDVAIWGRMPNWRATLLSLIASVIVAWLGFAWFQKTRRGFADVI
jgi:lipopolysaccharide transport system permease protein